jgi:hypothetical protein
MCLQELHQLAKETTSYKDIPEKDMDEMIHCLEEKRLIEKKGIQSRPQAHVGDVRATAGHVSTEVSDLLREMSIILMLSRS